MVSSVKPLGVDYSSARPTRESLEPYDFVCRYLRPNLDDPTCLKRDEAALLAAWGKRIVTIFESSAARAYDGHTAGYQDGIWAQRSLLAANGPPDGIVYFAIDVDVITDEQMEKVARYVQGNYAALGVNPSGVWRCGVYGEHDVCAYLAARRDLRITYFWQTGSWSHSRWFPAARIRQITFNRRLSDGSHVDFNTAYDADYGQWHGQRTGEWLVNETDRATVESIVRTVVREELGLIPRENGQRLPASAQRWLYDVLMNDSNHANSLASINARMDVIVQALAVIGQRVTGTVGVVPRMPPQVVALSPSDTGPIDRPETGGTDTSDVDP